MIYAWVIITFGIWFVLKEVSAKPTTKKNDVVVDYGISHYIMIKARKYGHDPLLIEAFVIVESAYDPDAKGTSNEIGLMQISPIVLKEFNNVTGFNFTEFHLHMIEHNLEVGCWYLRRLQDHYKLDKIRSIRAYNCGMRSPDREICFRYEARIRNVLEKLGGNL